MKENPLSSGAVTLWRAQPAPAPGRDGDFMQLLSPTPHEHERPVQEQNSKLIMPYLAKCSVST